MRKVQSHGVLRSCRTEMGGALQGFSLASPRERSGVPISVGIGTSYASAGGPSLPILVGERTSDGDGKPFGDAMAESRCDTADNLYLKESSHQPSTNARSIALNQMSNSQGISQWTIHGRRIICNGTIYKRLRHLPIRLVPPFNYFGTTTWWKTEQTLSVGRFLSLVGVALQARIFFSPTLT